MHLLDNSRSQESSPQRQDTSGDSLQGQSIDPYLGSDEVQYARDYKESFPKHAPPALDTALHADAREYLMDILPKRSLLIVIGGDGGSLGATFRQDSNFHYLTGFDHANGVALLSNVPGKSAFSLVVEPHDEKAELWDGARPGPDGAIRDYGAEQAYDLDDLRSAIRAGLKGARNIFVVEAGAEDSINRPNPAMKRRVLRAVRDARPALDVRDGTPYVREMRVQKYSEEVAVLMRAAEISAAGHLAAMNFAADKFHEQSATGVPMNEGQLQAVIEREFRDRGAQRPSFTTIVGAGRNGCTLHYNENTGDLKDGDLVLVDAGADYGYYAGDISRTWPVSGKFTQEQKQLHDLVCEAQERAIDVVKPGVTIAEVHEVAKRVIHEGLIRLGVLPEEASRDDMSQYFPHGTSHFLGMDVHDVRGFDEDKGASRPLQAGNLITVEPGIYIPAELGRQNGVEEKWLDIGIRIEDDILVTDTGHVNLTAMLPKSAEEIEVLMKRW